MLSQHSSFRGLMIAAAAKYYDYSKDNNPGAVIVKDVA